MGINVAAREFTLEINTGTVAVPVWTNIAGLLSIVPSSEETEANITDFDSGGIDESLTARRKHTLTAEGLYEGDDPGQIACTSAGELIGAASLTQYRWTDTVNVVTKTFLARTSTPFAGTTGGGVDDPAGWNLSLSVSGAITTA